ncbi:hypothetical protein BEL05_11905 [Shewanella colwelliana]|uniref:Cytochrome b561 bacterial/Ni-hydrogenase domain-containing protein n=1 Tax=Shewanella colwelliana TaxID=23 RepID=A0A1E5IWU0_SHECO|nr:cytochrome b/b6 domain-containing protein [Shewanella colwelliana]OEG74877.1 hypothetical protein BEL05_11905 [Shewanella colwelliana]
MPKWLSNTVKQLLTYQHLLVIVLSLFLISTSGWILMGRAIRTQASIWDLLHVYLGAVVACLSVSMLLTNVIKGKWRQYFSWLAGDFTQLSQDVCGLKKGKIPLAGGRGLFSAIEGIGLILLLLVSITGAMWYFTQGSSEALNWRSYHHSAAHGFIGFIIIHSICAAAHLLDFIRN